MGCPTYPVYLHYEIGQLLKSLRKWNRQQAPHQFVTVVLALATPKPRTSMRYWTRFVEMLRGQSPAGQLSSQRSNWSPVGLHMPSPAITRTEVKHQSAFLC